MALTPEISRALAEIASGLELSPELREEIVNRVPQDAQTEADLPEDLAWLLEQIRSERDREPVTAAASTRTLRLAGRPLTFSTAVLEPRVQACPDMPHPPVPGLDPDDDGSQLMAAALPQYWRGQLVPYNLASPDGRVIKSPSGEPKTRDMPLPLTAQVATADGHDNSVLVGRVNRVWTQDGSLWGEGEFDLATPEGRDWAGRVARGMAGWGSVDLDAGLAPRIESQGRNKVPKRTYNDWTFAGFTLVSRPAFDSARINSYNSDDERIDDERGNMMPEDVERALAPLNDIFADEAGVGASHGNCGCGGALQDDTGLSFPASGKTGLPMGPPAEWDGDAAQGRMRTWAGVNGDNATPANWSKYGQGFFWKAPGASKLGDFKLPFADVVDGTLTAMPRGIFAAAAAVQGSRGQKPDIPGPDLDGVRSHISAYYKKMKRPAPWDAKSMSASLYAGGQVYTADGISGVVTGYDAEDGWLRISCGRDADLIIPADELDPGCLTASAAAGPIAPPDAWFDNPNLPGQTALTVDDDGRVYGHLATWDTCHMAFSDTCTTPPRSRASYGYFHTGEVITASGRRLPIGKIVIGPGHAGPYAGWRAATSHYDRSGAAVVIGRVGEDAHGIWIAGSVVHDATPSQIASLRRSPISGDWRRIGGNLELVAALAVSVPGFPVPRPRAGIAYRQQASLVAAGVLDRQALATQNGLLELVEQALQNVLDGYADRRVRAEQAISRIAQAADDGVCTCGQCPDAEEAEEFADGEEPECTCGQCDLEAEEEE